MRIAKLAKKITCPEGLNIDWLKTFSIDDFDPNELGQIKEESSLTIDMNNVSFCSPAGLCGLHEIIRSHQGEIYIRRPAKQKPYQYLQRIGFFDHFKIFGDKEFTSYSASGRFKEMTLISKDIQPRSSAVDNLCKEIACVVAPDDHDFQDFILFCMGEMINNVIQHSHSKGITCAQFYKSTNEVEVAIADHGRGIKAGLKDNPEFHTLDCDLEALEISTRPDTSGTFDSASEPYRIQVNSGNGLYYLKKIIEKAYGHMDIFSYSAHYYQDGNQQPTIQQSSFFPGTLVVFRLNRDYTSTLQDVLGEIRQENLIAQQVTDSLPSIQFE
jgi:hypothetical protein